MRTCFLSSSVLVSGTKAQRSGCIRCKHLSCSIPASPVGDLGPMMPHLRTATVSCLRNGRTAMYNTELFQGLKELKWVYQLSVAV